MEFHSVTTFLFFLKNLFSELIFVNLYSIFFYISILYYTCAFNVRFFEIMDICVDQFKASLIQDNNIKFIFMWDVDGLFKLKVIHIEKILKYLIVVYIHK